MVNIFKTENGIITGRNGTWNLTAIQLSTFDKLARIDGVGQRGHTIRGGLSMDVETMDELAIKWLEYRRKHDKIS